jgi:hypothetical protein
MNYYLKIETTTDQEYKSAPNLAGGEILKDKIY